MQQSNRGAVLVHQAGSKIVDRGLERMAVCSGVAPDILHETQPDDPSLGRYAWVLELNAVASPMGARDRTAALAADAWAVAVEGETPVHVTVNAGSERARLFALYHVAECLATGTPPAQWAVARRPSVPLRYAWVSAGNCWSPVFRPDQFWQVIDALPGLGVNGVLLTCNDTHGTHYGQDTIPFTLTADGVMVDRHRLPVFRALFDDLKSYGLDIYLFHEAFTPPGFEADAVRAYYNGTGELPGFEDAVETSSRALAETMFANLPLMDGLFFHTLECDWMWGGAVSIFPCKDDGHASVAFKAYLRGLTGACRTHGKDLMYWTHASGISARKIRLQHELLAGFPEVLVVEDHAWPNNMWPLAPVMGHVAEDLRAAVVKGRFGLSIDTTDGEYYGAGALPTAYPDPHIRCGKAAADLGAEMSFVRMNQQSLTPLGTMEDINAIHVIGTVEQWWENPRPTDRLWREWCVRRFGAAAAPAIESALKKSRTLIEKGFTAGNMPLIDHSALLTGNWQPGPRRGWDVFARPGEPLVALDKPWESLSCPEIRCREAGGHGVDLEAFLRDSEEAEAAMEEALREIESVRDDLLPEDYAYLKSCFSDAIPILKAIRQTAIAARASALCMANDTEEHRRGLVAACAAMEACADRIETERCVDFRPAHWFFKTRLKGEEHKAYGLPIALRAIAESYRFAVERRHRETACQAP